MKLFTGVLSYLFAWGMVETVTEAITTDPGILGLTFVLLILSGLLSSYSKGEFNLDPMALWFMLRGVVSLSTFFVVPLPIFLIIPVIYFILGALFLKVPSIINSRRRKQNESSTLLKS